MTDELGSSARALLDAARQGLTPDAAAIQRVRAKVDVAVAAGATGAAAGLTLAGKLGILAVVAAVATGGYLYATRDRAPRRVEPVAIVAPAPAPPKQPIAPTPIVVAPPADRPVARVKPAPPPPAAKPARAQPPADLVLPPDPVAPKRKGIDLAREVELVDRAMAALRRDAPREALVAVRTHATETAGAGQLAEDAAAIEIEALCKLGDAAVATKLAAFEQRWPDSAQRSRLTTKCP